jgi:hypothetical protein
LLSLFDEDEVLTEAELTKNILISSNQKPRLMDNSMNALLDTTNDDNDNITCKLFESQDQVCYSFLLNLSILFF